jgi:hypothetical protein
MSKEEYSKRTKDYRRDGDLPHRQPRIFTHNEGSMEENM